MSGIVWLASYPKSGNTWFRILLANLRRGGPEPVHVNTLPDPWAANVTLFEGEAGIEAGDCTPAEIAAWRPRVYRSLAARTEGPLVLKVHDRYRAAPDAPPIAPAEATRAVVYLVRDPLDVAVSWAHHEGKDLDAAVRDLCDPALTLSPYRRRLRTTLPQPLGSWSEHVEGWLGAPLALHVVRYEDLHARPAATLAAAVGFLGLAHADAEVERAVAHSRIEVLQGQEAEAAFREKDARTRRFFREGRVGVGREVLTPAQVARLVAAHGPTMRRLGYPTGVPHRGPG